jgi:RNA polymerase sigma-70 factor (ECF subfamily)
MATPVACHRAATSQIAPLDRPWWVCDVAGTANLEESMDRSPINAGSPETDVQLGRAWRDHHRDVLDVAFRVLGSVSEAEDVVQEAYARLVRANVDEIDDVKGWLVVVATRLCYDQLRSARWRRQSPAAMPPDDAALTSESRSPDPADRVTLDDEVRMALHVVLARLTPAERTAYVLHDVFRYSFDDVAGIVGRSVAACRQLAARARHRIQADSDSTRVTVESDEQRRVTQAFIAAASTGDLDGLLAVLDPDVAGQADLGGTIGLLPPVVGRDAVAGNTLYYLGPGTSTTLLSLPVGEPTVVALGDGRVFGTFTLTIRAGRIHHIHGVLDTDKLADLNAILDP